MRRVLMRVGAVLGGRIAGKGIAAGARLAVTPSLDPHPNELAHRMAADRLFERVAAGIREDGEGSRFASEP